MVKDGALLVVERAADEPPLSVPGFEVLDERRYGAAKVTFARRRVEGIED